MIFSEKQKSLISANIEKLFVRLSNRKRRKPLQKKIHQLRNAFFFSSSDSSVKENHTAIRQNSVEMSLDGNMQEFDVRDNGEDDEQIEPTEAVVFDVEEDGLNEDATLQSELSSVDESNDNEDSNTNRKRLR